LWHSLKENGEINYYDVEWPDGSVETDISARLLEKVKDSNDSVNEHDEHATVGHKEKSLMSERRYKQRIYEKKKLSKKQLKIAKAAPPPDEITGADFAALRKKKNETLDEYVNSLNEKKKKKKKPSDHANYTAGRKNVSALDKAVAAYNKAKKTPGKADDMAAIKRRDRLEKKEKPSGIPSKYNMSEKLNRENLRSLILEIIKDELSEGKITGKAHKALKKKAKDANAPLGALKAIYSKGMGAFYSSGSRSGQNPHSWAMGRVNSVLRGGKARKVDDAQWKAIQKFRKKKRKK
jgi:hypothetical protein